MGKNPIDTKDPIIVQAIKEYNEARLKAWKEYREAVTKRMAK